MCEVQSSQEYRERNLEISSEDERDATMKTQLFSLLDWCHTQRRALTIVKKVKVKSKDLVGGILTFYLNGLICFVFKLINLTIVCIK